MISPKDILLLQGPVGPAFNDLQETLLKNGFNCTRVLFNLGGRLFCRNKKYGINFKGNLENWSVWLEAFIKKKSPDLVILFGADRPIESMLEAYQKNK